MRNWKNLNRTIGNDSRTVWYGYFYPSGMGRVFDGRGVGPVLMLWQVHTRWWWVKIKSLAGVSVGIDGRSESLCRRSSGEEQSITIRVI